MKLGVVLIALLITTLSYAQVDEVTVDSAFTVDPSSMNKNNYYLTYELQRGHHDEFNSEINTNLIWKKVHLDILWEIKSVGLDTPEDIQWESIDWNEINSQPDTFYCETTNNIPNGKWYYNSGDEKVIGFFVNGLASGSWDKTEIHQNGKIHIHQEFLNGIPHGEWYEEHNGIKLYSHVFLNGKPNGLWFDNFRNKKRETNYENGCKNGVCKTTVDGEIEQLYYYSNGIVNGDYFEYSSNTLVKKGSYDMGKPNDIWEIYKIDKTTKIRYLAYYYDFSNILQVKISEYYSNSKPKIIEIYENNGDLIIGGGSSSRIVNCPQNNGVCDCKTTTYFINGNIDKIVYGGSESYLNNKRFISNYENGKIKYEGVFRGKMYYYDLTGKIVNETIFNQEIFSEKSAN